jgi:cytoskeletal protein RodZ
VVVAIVAVIVAVRLVGGASPPRSTTPPPTRPASHTTTTLAPQAVSSSTRPAATTTTAPASSTTTSPPTSSTTTLAPGNPPQLSSISPSQGRGGTVVVIRGTNFFSPNGLVLAKVDGQPARTNCPRQTSCTVVMPSHAGPPSSVTVTITTEAGTSNALSFAYT